MSTEANCVPLPSGVKRMLVCTHCKEALAQMEQDRGARYFRCPVCMKRLGTNLQSVRDYVAWLCSLISISLFNWAFFDPLVYVIRLGEVTERGLLAGNVTLYREGKVFLAVIVTVCCIVFPVLKNLIIVTLGAGRSVIPARLARWLELFLGVIGPWGKLEILFAALTLIIMNFESELVQFHIVTATLSSFTGMFAFSMTASWLRTSK